ncbi:MAG: RNA 2',3'-cyclic phosphodiesterase [Armatimonadota bacterium]
MKVHRAFIAVELDAALQRLVADLQDRMRASGARLRWVKPHNVHFTLRFLGEIPAAQLARAVVAVRETARTAQPFTVMVAGLGAFPNFDRPQVIWLGSREGAEAFQRLAGDLEAALARQGFAPESRPFRPHLTLGRAKDDRQWGDLVRTLQRFRDQEIGQQPVRTLTVMESRLTVDGPVYTAYEQVPLNQELNTPPG